MTTTGSDWQSFDPSSGSLPSSISVPPGGPDDGGGILAVVADDSVEGGWGPQAALGIARAWAGGGARVMLADLGLARPSVHRALDVENEEGMSDVFLYGVSIQRVAHSVDDGAFFFAPAGTVVADAGGVKRHARWEALEKGFDSARAVLLLYLPSDEDGMEAMLDRASGVILLARRDVDPLVVLGDGAAKLLAVLGPEDGVPRVDEDLDFRVSDVEGGGPPSMGGAGPTPTPEVDGTREPAEEARTDTVSAEAPSDGPEGASLATRPGGDEGRGETALEGSPVAAAPPVEPDPEVPVDGSGGGAGGSASTPAKAPAAEATERPGTSGKPGKKRRSRIPLVLLILLLVLAGAVAAVWLGYLELPPGLEIPGLPTPG